MKRSLFVLASVLLASTILVAAEPTPAECLKHVADDGCIVTRSDVRSATASVDKCRRVMALGAKENVEVFVLKNAKEVVVIRTRGINVAAPFCPAARYVIDSSGVKQLLIINHHGFVLSNDGQIYMVNPDGKVLELLSTENRSYSTVLELREGKASVKNLLIIGKSFQKELTPEEFEKRAQRPVRVRNFTTREDLFFDF